MLKKYVSLLVLLMFASSILAFNIKPANCSTVFSQNFDGETTGSTPSGWIVTNPSVYSLTINDTMFHGSSGKSAKYEDLSSTNGAGRVSRTFDNQYGSLEFSFAVMVTDPEYFMMYIDDSMAYPSVHGANIYFKPDMSIAYYDSDWHYLRPFSLMTWYQIKMVIDIPTNTYDIYVDNVLEAKGVRFRGFGQAAYLNMIEIGGNTAERPVGYIDDLLLTSQVYEGPVATSVKLSGGLDYLLQENVKVRLDALVRDIDAMSPISGANVTVDIYFPNGTLWISDRMEEKLAGTGIYEWESNATIAQMNLDKGVYLVQAKASLNNDMPSTDILLFHIDPPSSTQTTPVLTEFQYVAIAIAIFAGAVLSTILLKRRGKMLKISKIRLA
jgi:hypothetical protein